MRFPLDVNAHRACLQQLVVLPMAPWVPKDRTPQRIHTLGGTVRASRFEANLRLRDGPRVWDVPERVVVVVHERWNRWLIGLEIMRRFHLLLPREQLATADEIL